MSPSCPTPTDVSGRRAVNVVPRSGVLSTSIALRALRKSTGRLPGPIRRHHCQVVRELLPVFAQPLSQSNCSTDEREREIAPGDYGPPRVFRNQISVDRRGGHDALGGSANNGGREVHHVTRHPHSWHLSQPRRISPDELAKTERMGRRLKSERRQHMRARNHGCADHHHPPCNKAPVVQSHARQVVVGDLETGDAAAGYADIARGQLFGLLVVERRPGVCEQHNIRRELAK